ncbi:MAG: transcriptional repressor [Selenomonadaceae bacterium]|nr:transcriptional repressor [Selenomonadaceae bacterium]MBQ7722970.1 transcriptional repressor [Selenomonadaceae bacterium]
MSENHQLFDLKDLRGKLSESGYKMTPQRKEILKIFVEHSERHHMSAEDVYSILRENDSEIGLATVYRALDLLSDLGILVRMDFGDGCARYELNTADPTIHHHHHLICLNCKKVIEFEEDLLEMLEAYIEKKSGFQIVNHEVKFFGYCSDCRAKGELNP